MLSSRQDIHIPQKIVAQQQLTSSVVSLDHVKELHCFQQQHALKLALDWMTVLFLLLTSKK